MSYVWVWKGVNGFGRVYMDVERLCMGVERCTCRCDVLGCIQSN